MGLWDFPQAFSMNNDRHIILCIFVLNEFAYLPYHFLRKGKNLSVTDSGERMIFSIRINLSDRSYSLFHIRLFCAVPYGYFCSSGMIGSNCFQHIIVPGISIIFLLFSFPNSLISIYPTSSETEMITRIIPATLDHFLNISSEQASLHISFALLSCDNCYPRFTLVMIGFNLTKSGTFK